MYLLFLLFALTSVSASKNAKRGLAVVDDADIFRANRTESTISWQYGWDSVPTKSLLESGIQFVPMQWGEADAPNFMKKVKAQGARITLGFNEPELQGQGNLDPSHAATLWKRYINPLSASGVRLGSPSISNSPAGRQWLISFLSACSGCTIDFLSIHWYGTGIGSFYDYLWQMHGTFPNWPIWVTEFASTSPKVLNFLNASIHYMDTLDWIERYAWFAYFKSDGRSQYNLLDSTGHLNALGRAYVSSHD